MPLGGIGQLRGLDWIKHFASLWHEPMYGM